MKINNFSNYEIYNNGTVYSYLSNKELSPTTTKTGYKRVRLVGDDGLSYSKYVHRLVAEAFLPNPNNYTCVNHKDENTGNNCVTNLEWCDYKYNNNYGTRNERIILTKQQRGFSIPSSAIKIIMKDKKTHQIINEFNSVKEAGRYLGKSASHINEAINGHRKSAYGYLWERKD